MNSKYVVETALFHCSSGAIMLIAWEKRKVTVSIWNTAISIPRIETFKFWSIKKAYENYLFHVGQGMRGGWKLHALSSNDHTIFEFKYA